MVDASDARAARFGRSRHHFAERAQGAGYDNDFSVHGASPKVFGAVRLGHDPEKCTAVFRKDHARSGSGVVIAQ
jgi:hypothetical protein